MKKTDLRRLAQQTGGEYVYGADDTGSHACYLIYGILKPGEAVRKVKPGKGHEEMLLSVNCPLALTGDVTGILEPGNAVHLSGEQTCYLENPGTAEATYVLAGGHSTGHGHHH